MTALRSFDDAVSAVSRYQNEGTMEEEKGLNWGPSGRWRIVVVWSCRARRRGGPSKRASRLVKDASRTECCGGTRSKETEAAQRSSVA